MTRMECIYWDSKGSLATLRQYCFLNHEIYFHIPFGYMYTVEEKKLWIDGKVGIAQK